MQSASGAPVDRTLASTLERAVSATWAALALAILAVVLAMWKPRLGQR
jgi:lipopolysaccharide export LptBFGC system permease protein LptF